MTQTEPLTVEVAAHGIVVAIAGAADDAAPRLAAVIDCRGGHGVHFGRPAGPDQPPRRLNDAMMLTPQLEFAGLVGRTAAAVRAGAAVDPAAVMAEARQLRLPDVAAFAVAGGPVAAAGGTIDAALLCRTHFAEIDG